MQENSDVGKQTGTGPAVPDSYHVNQQFREADRYAGCCFGQTLCKSAIPGGRQVWILLFWIM